MKIAEIVNFVADQEPEAARVSSFMQRIANAFTASGRVKRPFDVQGLGIQAATPPLLLKSSTPASPEGTTTTSTLSAVPNAGIPASMFTDPRSQSRSRLSLQPDLRSRF